MRRWMMILAAMSVVASCAARWTEHPDLPDWAQRGTLHWCLHYATADRELVDLFADGGQTFIHGGRFDSDETGEYAERLGLRYMPYVCSRTLTTTRDIAHNPQLQQAVVLKADGSEFLAYNNPVRRYGSLHTEAWPAYVRERVQRVRKYPDVWAIFFDNAFWPGDDHRPENIAAWQEWARERGIDPGDDVPSIYNAPRAAQSRAFSRDSLIAYHRGLQEYCHSQDPPLLNCPNSGNAYGLAALEAGVLDLMFYENSRHAPFYHNGFLYKAGLAAGHGRPTAMLSYIPPKIGQQRGVRTWNEGMHHFFYPSSPHAEEFALATAEAAAVGGNYVTCYNLFPALPITDTSDPFNKRIYREIKRMNSFLRVNEDLYGGAQPGSDVAILYSSDTALQNRRLSNYEALSLALTRAGIPYEVVVASDLRERGGVAGVRTLVLPNVLYIDEAAAEGAARFVRQGGRAIITGSFAAYDENGIPAHPAGADDLLAPLGLVTTAVTDWKLDGYEPEGSMQIKATRDGATASLRFDGEPGQYVVHIAMSDENDGTSSFSFAVADTTVLEGKLDREDNSLRWVTSEPFALKRGDVMTFTGYPDGGEPCRVRSIVVVRAGEDGAQYGHGRVLYSPTGLENLEPDKLLDLLQPPVSLSDPGEVMINLMDVPDLGISTVHLVNYGLKYDVTIPGLYASDDGESEARMFFGGRPVAVRKRIRIPDLKNVADPVLQIRGFAVGESDAKLLVTINGKPAATIALADMRGHGWFEVPIERGLLAAENIIEIHAEGQLNGQDKWIQIDIDTSTHEGNSWFSTDGGATFFADDLSTDLKDQTGEYMIRIKDRSPGNFNPDTANLVHNPDFEHVTVPHSETKITVMPATNLAVLVDGKPRACLAISPDGPSQWIEGRAVGKTTRYLVPRVDYYTVLLLADNRAALQPFLRTNDDEAVWTLPRVTEPLRANITGWQGFGAGFASDESGGRGGGRAITCRNSQDTDIRGAWQQFTFADDEQPTKLTITAWSRCEGVSGKRDAHYSVYVDATCADGTVFNGHYSAFDVGSHDWQQVTLQLDPPAPIRTMKLFLLLRKHSGRVWFDDVRMIAR
ncbi:MAG: hypothetical protein J7M38_06640 [Armatimonadetes bacterium]|nr:hypothetical protein [Armatimonadota bacterium]